MINLSRVAFLNVSVALPFIYQPQSLHSSGLCYCLNTFNFVFTCTAPNGQDSLGFWISCFVFWIPCTGFSGSLLAELGFYNPIVSGIPGSLSCIPDSKAHNSKFHRQKFPGCRNPDSLTWGKLYQFKTTSDIVARKSFPRMLSPRCLIL